MIALLVGATGLVGQELLVQLLADPRYTQVHTLGRRNPACVHAKLHAHTVDFANLRTAAIDIGLVDDVYIALGTTIKAAGSKAAFRAVDFDVVLAVALFVISQTDTYFVANKPQKRIGIVSAMGADVHSRLFYSQVKGEMEAAVAQLGYSSTVFVRPSLLSGNRVALSQSPRLGEQIGLAFMRPLQALIPDNYKAIEARQVAKALIYLLTHATSGVQVASSGQLRSIA